MNLARKKEYSHYLDALGDTLHDVEHFRGTYECYHFTKTKTKVERRPAHVAVVVLKDGRCYVGSAKVNNKDQYCRRRGHGISVGRALKAACIAEGSDRPNFIIPAPIPNGVLLRDECRCLLREHCLLPQKEVA